MTNIQKACETVETLLAKESATTRPKLTATEFIALNEILLELQVTGKYSIPEGVH